jgi:hypothetical protein
MMADEGDNYSPAEEDIQSLAEAPAELDGVLWHGA